MATDGLWQRTQIGFLPRNTSEQHDMSKFPPSQLSSQLQFNMGIPAMPENMATHFTKPKPIVIEKLEGPKPDIKNKTFISRIPENFPLANASSLSSDRLDFAVNLAKRDIKRAKLMPAADEQVTESPTKVKVKRPKKEGVQPKETMRNRVHKSLRHYDKEMKKAHSVRFFYPSSPHSLNDDSESHHAREIRKLRKELNLHLKQLHDLQQDRPIVLQNKDKRLKSRKENLRLSDDEIDDRQIARSGEQTIRSSRILYTLQRQIRDLQDELNKKGKNIKHTKKSQTLHRLAAAHRAALRALQTFISQTPLHSKASNGGPDMYQELAILVQQLSLLTAQLQADTDEELIDDLAERHHGQHYQYQRNEGSSSKHGAFFKDVDETSFKQLNQPSPPTRDRENKTIKKVIPSHPSPERNAVLRAGLEALVRAREEALNAEKSKMKSHIASRSSVLPAKKSVLLPAPLKAKRQRIHPAAAVQRLQPTDIKQAGFAKDTVSSTLRKIETADNQPPKSPPRTPTKCPQRGTPIKNHGSPERLCEQTQLTPKSHSQQPEEELKSPRSTKYQRQMLPEERKMVEREIARQLWLDKEADLCMQELEDEMRRKRHHPGHSSDGVRLARQMIQETEEAIMKRLKPLLDRAEAIVTANTKHEEMKKRSLKHQLTDLTARTTMEQAHLLADEILEDILDDTVLELQRLEVEQEAEMAVSGLQNQSTIENIMQKLQSFEEGESDIRRYWTRVRYDDITSHEESSTQKQTAMEYQPHHPEPIRFSKHKPTGNYLDKKVRHLNSGLIKHRKRFDGDESPTDSGSTASLLEGISTNRSSAVTSQISERHRPPTTQSTITLFVPSELRTSIAAYRSRFERFLRDTATHIEGSFDPWKLADQISEVLLDEMIQDVAVELGGVCDEYTENIFTKEFVPATDSSLVS